MTSYPPFAVTVDLALLTIRDDELVLLLIQRAHDPFAGQWALPGGFVEIDEDAETAARRELFEETGVDTFGGHIEQLRSYSDPDRDPRQRVVSIAHLGFAPNLPDPTAGSDAALAQWWPVNQVLATSGPPLAFDHAKIVADAIERVRSKLEYTTLATEFVPEPFTLAQLRAVYAAVWGQAPELGQFRRAVLSTDGFVLPEPTSAGQVDTLLFRRGPATLLHPALLRPAG